MQKKKTIILTIGVVAIIAVGGVVIYSSKSHKESPSNIKISPTKKPPHEPKPISPPPKPHKTPSSPLSFPLDNIPAERKNISGEIGELTPNEKKAIIESLAFQVKLDKNYSFDFKHYFDMFSGTRETFEVRDGAFCLFTDKGKFFVRINNFSDLSRFEYEKESMLTINETVPNLAPCPLVLGNLPEGGKFLVVNFIEARWHDRLKVENQKLLAKSLAQLHQKKSPNGKFGFHIGKNNQWKDSWMTFFYENRWQPLWKRVLAEYPQDRELKKWGTIIGEKVIPELLSNLPVEPVLLHGNLDFDSWDINSHTNQPWLFGAHSYYGHNEMDLSLIHYYWPRGKVPELGDKEPVGEFFESEFLAEYQKYKPLPPGFEERKTLYRLYNWIFLQISRGGHPSKKFEQKTLTKLKKLGQKYG